MSVVVSTVVVQPSDSEGDSGALKIAASMESARREIDGFRSATASLTTLVETLVTDKFAFAFDIDGVLIRGGKAIPEAIDAVKVLNGNNWFSIKMYARVLFLDVLNYAEPD